MINRKQIAYAATLIGRIDSGERNVFCDSVNTDQQIECKLFDEGILFACLYENGLRMHIAFEADTDAFNEELAALVRGSLKKAGKRSCVIWIRNENRKIIAYLKKEFSLPEKQDYASIEFIMRRGNFCPTANDTLEIRPYERKRLFAYLDMLDHSMTYTSAQPGFRDAAAHHRRLFARLAKENAFEAFWRDGELIGLYWRNNAEIDVVSVAQGQQRRGYGTIILTRAIEMAFQCTDADYAYLYAVDWNEKGQAFYKKYGMEESGHSYCLRIENYRE